MYEFWYIYVKPKHLEYIWKSFIVYIKIDDYYKDIAKYVETRFNTSNNELDRPLPNGINKK